MLTSRFSRKMVFFVFIIWDAHTRRHSGTCGTGRGQTPRLRHARMQTRRLASADGRAACAAGRPVRGGRGAGNVHGRARARSACGRHTFKASLPVTRVFKSCSLMMTKGRPYSSKTTLTAGHGARARGGQSRKPREKGAERTRHDGEPGGTPAAHPAQTAPRRGRAPPSSSAGRSAVREYRAGGRPTCATFRSK